MTVFELYQEMERELATLNDSFIEAHHDGLLVIVGEQEFWVTAKEQPA